MRLLTIQIVLSGAVGCALVAAVAVPLVPPPTADQAYLKTLGADPQLIAQVGRPRLIGYGHQVCAEAAAKIAPQPADLIGLAPSGADVVIAAAQKALCPAPAK